MNDQEKQILKAKFFRLYSNLPVNERRQIVSTLKDAAGPVTWEVAFLELSGNTPLGDTILEELNRLDIIK